jgi:hypothetical protein
MDLEGIRKWEWCVGTSDRMEVVGVERVVRGYGPSMLEMVNSVERSDIAVPAIQWRIVEVHSDCGRV